MAKSIWTSKTFWFNILTGGLALVDQLSPMLPENLRGAIPTIVMVGNILLRFVTTQPVSISPTK